VILDLGLASSSSVLSCSVNLEVGVGLAAVTCLNVGSGHLGSVFASSVFALSLLATSDVALPMCASCTFDLSASSFSSLAMCSFHESPVFQLFSPVGSDPSMPSTLDAGGLVVSSPVSHHPLQVSRVPCGPLGLGLACWVATGHQWH